MIPKQIDRLFDARLLPLIGPLLLSLMEGGWQEALIVFVASVLVPLLKIGVLAYLVVTVRAQAGHRELRTRPVQDCVKKALSNARWPRFEGERKNVSVPFNIKKPKTTTTTVRSLDGISLPLSLSPAREGWREGEERFRAFRVPGEGTGRERRLLVLSAFAWLVVRPGQVEALQLLLQPVHRIASRWTCMDANSNPGAGRPGRPSALRISETFSSWPWPVRSRRYRADATPPASSAAP